MVRRRREARTVDIWPGFVDALSTLILAFIFLLVVFVLGQFFLSQQLLGRNQELRQLGDQVSELAQQLGLSKTEADDLRLSLSQVSADLRSALADKDALTTQLNQSEADRATLSADLGRSRDLQLGLQRRIDELTANRNESADRSADLERQLAEARQLVSADEDKLKVQLAELVQLRNDIQALTALRARLEGQVADLATRTDAEKARLLAELGQARDAGSKLEARLADEQSRTMLAQKELQDRQVRLDELMRSVAGLTSARDQAQAGQNDALAQVQALKSQIGQLSDQLRRLAGLLDEEKSNAAAKDTTIADLGRRLNLALADKVEELNQSRSDFFGRLRQVLGSRQDVRIVGDRFVFPSDVLFTSGEADIAPAGRDQLAKLAAALKDMISEIPNDLPWVLQVDGHTDSRPISNARFASNWELSAARAISVARFLIEQGIPPDRVAARGFAQFQPLDNGTSEEAFARNRRIEIKLTTR